LFCGFSFQAIAPQLRVRVARHLDPPASRLGQPGGEGARVGAIGPEQVEARQRRWRFLDEALRSEPIVEVGGMNTGEQDEPACLGQDETLAAFGSLGAVVATLRRTGAAAPHRLTVDDCGRRFNLTAFGHADL
jgi:hypothetical protein